MSNLQHRAGVRDVNLVVRHMRLSRVSDDNRDAMMNEIDHLFGIDEAIYNSQQGAVYLAYDATHIDLDGIEEVIRKHGADIHDDWWTHTKEGYYKFVDQNIKDNDVHEPWCCHKIGQHINRKS